MTTISFTSDIVAAVTQSVGSDASICDAARVSTLGQGVLGDPSASPARDHERDEKLIRYLMTSKHGSPFEHGSITFVVNAPILVWWDHVRHRIGTSYNIESSRYRQLQPVFYVHKTSRTQAGKPGAYTMTEGSPEQTDLLHQHRQRQCQAAWEAYVDLLAEGIAREQAMEILPMCTVITGYVTFNPRSLMNFLELRLGPAREEMQILARAYMHHFELQWPITTKAFRENGLLAP
jgi:thymidylate synthase (FAD)